MTRQGESDTLNGSEGRSSLFDRSGCHSESTIQQQNTKRRGDSDSANESSLVSRPGMWNSSQSKPATTTDTISTQPTLPTNSTNTASLRTAIESETDAAHFPADRERTPVQRDGRKLNSRSSFGAHSVLYQGKLHAFIKKKDLSGCHQMRLCNLFLSEQNMDDKDESLHEIFDEIICCMTKKGHQWPLWKDRNGNIWLGDDPGELFDDFKQQDMSVEERREVLASTNPAMEPPPMLDTPVPTPVASVAAESAHPSIPLVVIEGIPETPPDNNEEGNRNKNILWKVSLIVLFGFALILGGFMVGSARGGKGSSATTVSAVSPTSLPTISPTMSPILLPTSMPTSMPTVDPWQEHGQTLSGARVVLAASGNILAIGVAALRSVGGGQNELLANGNFGEVRVYDYNDAIGWVQKGQILLGDSLDDGFGASMALSADGSIIAVGAFLFGNETVVRSGQVRSWAYDSTTSQWLPFGQTLFGENTGEIFGHSLSLSSDGKVLAVGAPKNSELSDSSGQVRYFTFGDNEWIERRKIFGRSKEGHLGTFVALSSDGAILAAGAPGNDRGGGTARVLKFDPTQNRWTNQGDILEGESDSDFGSAVALSADGHTLAVGAPYDIPYSTRHGQVEIYQYNEATLDWNKIDEIQGVRPNDRFGSSLALSGDGTVLAAGAYLYDFDDLISVGHVRIFKYNDGSQEWDLYGPEKRGKKRYDEFGVTVALSSDGSIVAAGRTADASEDTGDIRLFAYVEPI